MKVIIINSFDTFEYRVMLLKKVLKKQGAEVLVVGSDYRHIEKTRRESTDPELHLLHALSYRKNISVARIASHMRFASDAYEYIKDRECDILYLVVPPNSQATIAKKYRKKHPNVKVVMDLIDLWPESFPSNRTEQFPFSLWGKLRNDNLKYADLILTECSLYQDKLKPYLKGKQVETLYWAHDEENTKENITEALSVPKAQNREEKNEELAAYSLGYLGSVNNIIDLQAIRFVIEKFAAISEVDFHIVGGGEALEALERTAREAGAKVYSHGKIYDAKKKAEIFSRCHYGLNLMKDTVVVGLSMKSIDYLEMGLPIINSLKGDTRKLVLERNIGFNVEDIDTVLEQYNCDSKEERDQKNLAQRENARKVYEENFSYGAFESKVLAILSKLEN